jgi:hypothetical protein
MKKKIHIAVIYKVLIQSSSENGRVYKLMSFQQKFECLVNTYVAQTALLNKYKNNHVLSFESFSIQYLF